MTIIAIKDRIMAADSWTFSAGVGSPAALPKITRALDGSLVGASGGCIATELFRDWVHAGMNFTDVPKLEPDDDDPYNKDRIAWLWLKPDGGTRYGDHRFRTHPISTPGTVGMESACLVAEGAMIAGASAEEAVRIAISRCVFVGGEPQVEHLIAPKIVTRTYNRCSNCGYCYTEDYRGRECTWCYTLL